MAIDGIAIIIGMPLTIIMQGIPACIMLFIAWQRSRIMSICEASIGVTLKPMPSLVVSMDILHIIGCII